MFFLDMTWYNMHT